QEFWLTLRFCITFVSTKMRTARILDAILKISGCTRGLKYTALRTMRACIANRLARQKHNAHKAKYPIRGIARCFEFSSPSRSLARRSHDRRGHFTELSVPSEKLVSIYGNDVI